MRVRTPSLLLTAALLSGTLLPLAGPASADTGPVPLGMATLADLVLDEGHGRLFLSPGPTGTGVRVTDLQGGAARVVDGLPGATGMALTPDGRSLWVALPSVGALKRVDTATLAVSQTIAVPTGQCPGDVAVVGSRLIYGHSCNTYGSGGSYGGIGVVDAVTGVSYGGDTTGPYYKPVVAAGLAGQVYAADAGLNPTGLHLYDVTGSSPRLVASRAQVCSNLRDLSAAPDGSRVVTACGSPYAHTIWSADKLAELGTFPSGHYPLAGAWSADGSTFAAGLDSAYEPDVYVYREGLNAPARVVDFGSTSARLRPRGLAASGDGLRVWAVTGTTSSDLALRVVDVPSPDSATITLTATPQQLYPGSTSLLSGRLATVAGAALPGRVLQVSRGATGEAPVTLPEVTTDADGRFAFADTPAAAGSYVYAVSHDADAARAEVPVLVWRTEGTLLLDLTRGTSGGVPVEGTVQLYYDGPTSTSGLTVRLVRVGGGVREELPSVTTDAKGRAAFTDRAPAGDVTYTATVAANGVHPEATATRTTTVLTATTLTATAPATSLVGAQVTVSGTLSAPAGVVVAGTVSVKRSGCGTAGWGDSVATSSDGGWSVTDPSPPTGTCTWAASYAGGDGYASSTASATTTVNQLPTALTATAPDSAIAGDRVSVTGTLSSGGAAVADATVSVQRSGCSSGGWQGSATTTSDGSWSTTDPAAPGGTCSYKVTFGGSGALAAATASASTTVSFRPTDLGLSVVRGTGSMKKHVYVTAQLGATHTNRMLRITVQPTGGAETLLVSGTVDSSGRLTATYAPKTTTTYRVSFAGDAWYAPATAERTQ